MPFFDSHFHVTLKKQFANPKANRPGGLPPFSPWHTATKTDFLEGFKAISLAKCLLRPFVESSLVSQSSLSQLTDNGYKLGMVALFTPDRGLMELILNNPQFIAIVQKGKFGDFLLKAQFEAIKGTNNPFEVVKRDLELIDEEVPGRSVVKLLDENFDPAPGDPMSLVFTVEGLHSLRSDMNKTDPEEIIKEILKNLDSISGENRVISINITHIDNNNSIFANQAYAMDGFREAGFVEINLRPVENGLTAAGRSIATKLYERQVLPDLKHMSWLSRKEFYQFRRDKGITAPLVCSHAGFTGCWFDSLSESITDFIVQVGDDQHVTSGKHHKVVLSKPNPYLTSSGIGFNASSINLFNEDIRQILESDGLIGISLDQRILGYSDFEDNGNVLSKNVIDIDGLKVVTDADYISVKEVGSLPQYTKPAKDLKKIMRGVITEDRMTGNSTNVRKFFHPRHFYLHIVHAMQVARTVGQLNNGSGEESAVRMLTRTLCIGSDFDGMIDGLDCCPDVTHMDRFMKTFIREFGPFLKEVKLSLPADLTVQKLAERIFYENGRDFVLRRLHEINKVKSAAPAGGGV